MKTALRNLASGLVVLSIAVLVLLAFSTAGPAFSPSALAVLAPKATPPPGEVIPIQSMNDLKSFDASVTLQVNGLIDGERTEGELNGLLTVNEGTKSRITVSGDLLGELATRVGGSMVGLFTPSKVDVYKTLDGAYIVIGGLVPICIKPKALNATDTLEDMSPSSLMGMLTSSDVARGELVGEETLNGVRVKHYVIDGDAFLAAAQESEDEKLRAFAEGLWSADDAHVFVDAKTGYPVAFRGSYSGEYEPLKFEGEFAIEIDLTNTNSKTKVSLPPACNRPISQ